MSFTLPATANQLTEGARSTAEALRPRADQGHVRSALRALDAAFDQPFTLVDVESGEVSLAASTGLTCNPSQGLELLRETIRRGQPEIIEHESPLSLLAVPLGSVAEGQSLAAVSVMLTMRAENVAEMASAARVFGVDAQAALQWSRSREVWTPRVLLRLAQSTIENVAQRALVSHLHFEINNAVAHARDTYVELGLLHRMARGLDVAQDPGQLVSRAVSWLSDAIPAQCVAAIRECEWPQVNSAGRASSMKCEVIQGECPLDAEQLMEMIRRLGDAARRPLVFNRAYTSTPTWGFPTVRELACAPIVQGSRVDGWLVALNHTGRDAGELCEFGSAEIRLLDSVSGILGVHRSNAALFHRQGELFAASVKALTSAIDAKDRYTRGHSERVARVAVCLAEQLGLDNVEIETLYLGGLLHDIGKIGVDDRVLNKPGPLTSEEFEQVKQHPQLGYDILRGVRQLERILPIVLHHHEAWDGSGYPGRLKGDETPLLARVAAVADAYDAMLSDRPYRSGLAEDALDEVFRDGAGRQWDAQVVDAFFACRETIRRMAWDDSIGAVALDPLQWVSLA